LTAQVSAYEMASHLGLTRQGVDALTAQGVLACGADGLFNMTQSRLAYIAHLKTARRTFLPRPSTTSRRHAF
jgi:hypothetical protein